MKKNAFARDANCLLHKKNLARAVLSIDMVQSIRCTGASASVSVRALPAGRNVFFCLLLLLLLITSDKDAVLTLYIRI